MFFYSDFEGKKCLVLTKFSNKKTDVIIILNFYELNNFGNTNIWGAYINLHRFRKLLNSNKDFLIFILEINISQLQKFQAKIILTKLVIKK